jgi:hypothetical protein
MRRTWSIRSKIIALVTLPVSAMLALWIFATVLTVGPAINLLSFQTLVDKVSRPGWTLLLQVQEERRLSVAAVTGTSADLDALASQRVETDRAVAQFKADVSAGDTRRASTPELRQGLDEAVAVLDGLPDARARIDGKRMTATQIRAFYGSFPDSVLHSFNTAATSGDDNIDDEIRALIVVGRGQEYLSRADAILVEAFADGKLTAANRTALFESIGGARYLLAQARADLPERDQQLYAQAVDSAAAKRLIALQDQLLETSEPGAALPISEAAWRSAYEEAAGQLLEFQRAPADALPEQARPTAVRVIGQLAGAGIIGLLAVAASIFFSVRIGRSIVGRLTTLRFEALEMANERLPKVVRRLQHGETVDVEHETPKLDHSDDEVGQVGRAFNEVQRTAIASAVEEASVRRGMNEVFLNIARRSQTLLHRQLTVLDAMERRETEPQDLEDLYRVDHLATRMRRHAEDLVILAGSAPGRGWRIPVPAIDVIRGSMSEVEDYKRIDVAHVESAAVVGRAVGDVIHLLAELLENATSFSPPTTRIAVSGQMLPNGYAIEIEDRGLGMSAEAIVETNRRLAEPPDFDPSDSARLGLFVVARLADRQNIKVQLRSSAYGGVTAVVLIPGDLVSEGTGTEPEFVEPTSVEPAPPTHHGHNGHNGYGGPNGYGGHNGHHGYNGYARVREMPAEARPEPTPSLVLDELNADGLVQRRRTAPPVETPPAQPEQLPPNLTAPPSYPETMQQGYASPPVIPAPRGGEPTAGVRPMDLRDVRPQLNEMRQSRRPVDGSAPLADESLLPRRVRQASLAPQLREPVREEAVTHRPPDEVRSIMSSLQRGTNQGRRDAAAPAWGEAATSSLPAVHHAPAPNLPAVHHPPAPESAGGPRHAETQQFLRSEEDA